VKRTPARQLLDTLTAAGIVVSVTGDKLNLDGPRGALTPELIANVKGHKPALLELLSAAHNGHPVDGRRHALAVPRVRPSTIPTLDSPARPAPPSAAYRLVTDAEALVAVLAALGDAEEVALDLETTGLDGRRDRTRLLTVAVPTIDGGPVAYLVDCFRMSAESLAPLLKALAEKVLVGHNLAFDLSFLAGMGFTPGRVADTMVLSLLLDGPRKPRGYHGLAQVAERELGVTLDKTEQRSDWSATGLTGEQLRYAARDALVLLPLYGALGRKVAEAGMAKVADIESRCLPAMAWLSRAGVPFNFPAWEALAAEAVPLVAEAESRLNDAAPARPERIPGLKTKLPPGPWDWGSGKQVAAVFAMLGIKVPRSEKGNPSTKDEVLAGIDHPLAALLRDYRGVMKRTTTYGPGWVKDAYHGGRLYAEWRQQGCITGRMASARPNLQNLPTDPRYRACFRAPEGRVLVKADYSQIELRIAAKVTGDQAMLDAYARGDDLHALTARRMLGKAEVTPAERKLAKPVNFGLIYGLSAGSLRRKAKAEYGLDLTAQEAERYRRAFFQAYPGVAAWHRRLRAESAPAVRTLAGRRCPLPEKHFYGTRANYTVQGTGGDGFKAALALLWERRDQCPGAFPVLAVHDEIIIEADADQAEAAAGWLKQAMLDGMSPLLDPVPVEVEAKVGRTWGGADGAEELPAILPGAVSGYALADWVEGEV
jgi:DNA polymerase-1